MRSWGPWPSRKKSRDLALLVPFEPVVGEEKVAEYRAIIDLCSTAAEAAALLEPVWIYERADNTFVMDGNSRMRALVEFCSHRGLVPGAVGCRLRVKPPRPDVLPLMAAMVREYGRGPGAFLGIKKVSEDDYCRVQGEEDRRRRGVHPEA